jgi:hypothetical protein
VRTKVTLVLVFLNVALFFFIFKFERHWRTEAASLEARRRVLGPEAVDIRSLEVSGPNGPLFALARNRDTWTLTKPLDWPANPAAVSSILHELQLLEHETSFPTKDLGKNNNPTLADYGLDKPKLIVAFTSGDPAASGGPLAPVILRIGDTTNVGRLYILSPDGERIHVVQREKIESLFASVDQLRADTLITIPVFEASSLSIQAASPDQARNVVGGARVLVRRDGTHWGIFAPITARANKTATELAINRLGALRARSFPASAPATLPAVSPSIRVTLEGNNRHQTLFLGESVARAAATPAPSGPSAEKEYYGQLEGRAAVFTVMVPNDLAETLRNATEPATGRPGSGLRETRLLDFDPALVSAVTIAAPGRTGAAPLTLQRLDTSSRAGESPAWQIVQRGSGDQGLRTAAADREAVQQLLTRLTQLSAQAFVSDSPSAAELENWGFNRPEREITLTLAAANPGPAATTPPAAAAPTSLVLRLGVDPNRKVYARVGTASDPGSSVYAVDVDLARDFPSETIAWRDRALPFVPPNTRLTALKLTDLATHRVVFETTLDATGQPAKTSEHPALARNPKLLPELIRHVRDLRARSFRPEPFGEKIFAAGEERSWRYQLEATLSLPGGAGGEQTETKTLLLTERLGGAAQLAGSKEFDFVFEIEQPLLDALWALTANDPGPPPPAPEEKK